MVYRWAFMAVMWWGILGWLFGMGAALAAAWWRRKAREQERYARIERRYKNAVGSSTKGAK